MNDNPELRHILAFVLHGVLHTDVNSSAADAWREHPEQRRYFRGTAGAVLDELERRGFTIKPPSSARVTQQITDIATIPPRLAYDFMQEDMPAQEAPKEAAAP